MHASRIGTLRVSEGRSATPPPVMQVQRKLEEVTANMEQVKAIVDRFRISTKQLLPEVADELDAMFERFDPTWIKQDMSRNRYRERFWLWFDALAQQMMTEAKRLIEVHKPNGLDDLFQRVRNVLDSLWPPVDRQAGSTEKKAVDHFDEVVSGAMRWKDVPDDDYSVVVSHLRKFERKVPVGDCHQEVVAIRVAFGEWMSAALTDERLQRRLRLTEKKLMKIIPRPSEEKGNRRKKVVELDASPVVKKPNFGGEVPEEKLNELEALEEENRVAGEELKMTLEKESKARRTVEKALRDSSRTRDDMRRAIVEKHGDTREVRRVVKAVTLRYRRRDTNAFLDNDLAGQQSELAYLRARQRRLERLCDQRKKELRRTNELMKTITSKSLEAVERDGKYLDDDKRRIELDMEKTCAEAETLRGRRDDCISDGTYCSAEERFELMRWKSQLLNELAECKCEPRPVRDESSDDRFMELCEKQENLRRAALQTEKHRAEARQLRDAVPADTPRLVELRKLNSDMLESGTTLVDELSRLEGMSFAQEKMVKKKSDGTDDIADLTNLSARVAIIRARNEDGSAHMQMLYEQLSGKSAPSLAFSGLYADVERYLSRRLFPDPSDISFNNKKQQIAYVKCLAERVTLLRKHRKLTERLAPL